MKAESGANLVGHTRTRSARARNGVPIARTGGSTEMLEAMAGQVETVASAKTRRRLRRYVDRMRQQLGLAIDDPEPPAEITRNQRCGAMTKTGEPCQNRNIYPNGRCKDHGGPSNVPAAVLWAHENL